MDQKQKPVPKISIFDKRAKSIFNTKDLNKTVNTHGQTAANAPQFRINQHKGA